MYSKRRRQQLRLFYDTIKGGDYRAREEVYRLAGSQRKHIGRRSRRAFRLPANTEGVGETDPFCARDKYRGRSTPAAKNWTRCWGSVWAANRQIANGKV